MADSGQKINYNLRFAKHVERKMLCDAFLEMRPFGGIKKYRYVGFGSFYFSDFTLFHKRLGLDNMISIEANEGLEVRCTRNKLFECIDLKPGKASKVLRQANFSWLEKTIIWLDYDKELQNDYLDDIGFTCPKLASGSIVLVTVNAHPDREDTNRVEKLKEKIDEQYLPLELKQSDLGSWGKARVYRDIITAVINRVLNESFAATPAQERLAYQQLFNFRYNDGARMLTVGGILFKEKDRPLLQECQFDALPFVRQDSDSLLVEIPQLTYREMKYLDSLLPRLGYLPDEYAGNASGIPGAFTDISSDMGIPPLDILKYANIYRFFPTFVDAEV